jgi:hypothetical protein
MLIKSSKDLSGAFIIGAGNRLLTVGTVENQHSAFTAFLASPSSQARHPIDKALLRFPGRE